MNVELNDKRYSITTWYGNSADVTHFERTKKKGVDRWAADSNGARITRQKLTISK